jgi:ribosomal protein L35
MHITERQQEERHRNGDKDQVLHTTSFKRGLTFLGD